MLQDRTFWGLMVLTALFGFMVGLGYFALVKYTSPLTCNVTGNVKVGFGCSVFTSKGAVQVAFGAILFGLKLDRFVSPFECASRCRAWLESFLLCLVPLCTRS